MRADVARLMVTFNSAKALREIACHAPAEVETTIIDNGSSDESCATAACLGYRVLRLPANHGYGRAIMRGLEAMDHEFVLVANPDAKIDERAIESLLDAATRYPACDFFAPALIRADGRPFFRFDSKFDTSRRNRVIPDGEACIRVLSGAAFLVRRSQFLQHGFDTNIFLYFEDDELGLSYARAQRPMIYVPNATIQHVGNASSDFSQAIEDLKARSFGWSWGYVMAKHEVGSLPRAIRSTALKAAGALATFRLRSFRRQALILAGLRSFANGRPAPYLPAAAPELL